MFCDTGETKFPESKHQSQHVRFLYSVAESYTELFAEYIESTVIWEQLWNVIVLHEYSVS